MGNDARLFDFNSHVVKLIFFVQNWRILHGHGSTYYSLRESYFNWLNWCSLRGKLYEKIGFNKEIISKGRYAELYAADRSFKPDEEKLFAEDAQNFYEQFRDKAACSRSMSVCVDAIGGFSRAVAIAKHKANIHHNKKRVMGSKPVWMESWFTGQKDLHLQTT
ncbi:hypothetical protein L1987_08477 [Smallanthus sonchifolius]|uniref:Uncharacterized protein n=1 Tax=Smallanthus sonchifolius TaxID=185202 RepID=A0ACB9JMP4_9ASTR|nr:hypothetical protein L1987_08477 [Smallanthus sonchifolius]